MALVVPPSVDVGKCKSMFREPDVVILAVCGPQSTRMIHETLLVQSLLVDGAFADMMNRRKHLCAFKNHLNHMLVAHVTSGHEWV